MELQPVWCAVLTLAIGLLGTVLFAFTRARHEVPTSRTWWVGVGLSVLAASRADLDTLIATSALMLVAAVVWALDGVGTFISERTNAGRTSRSF